MPFQNPILSGTTLTREAIQSPNYTPGILGWTINRDGSAEFNNITIRGGTVEGGVALYYNGTPALGNLVGSIAAAAGVDQFGNAYLAGFTSYGTDGSFVESWENGAAQTDYQPPNEATHSFAAAEINAQSFVEPVGSGSISTSLVINGPSDNNVPGGDTNSSISLANGNGGSSIVSLDGGTCLIDCQDITEINSAHWQWSGLLNNGQVVSTGPLQQACTVATTATTAASATNITGQAVTVTPPATHNGAGTYEVDVIIDCSNTTFVAGVGVIGRLLVNGALVAVPTVPWIPTAAGGRQGVIGKWVGTCAQDGVNATTFQAAIALTSGTTARFQAQTQNSTITVKTYSN